MYNTSVNLPEMKILLYNIAYSTGLKGSLRDYFLKFWRYLWARRKTLKKITEFLGEQNADIVCLLEIDGGSIRNRFKSQAKMLADKLSFPFYFSKPKYHPRSINRLIPTIRKQHDAILSMKKGHHRVYYFGRGTKKLIQEFTVENISIFLVHLSLLRKKLRKSQLKELTKILKNCPREYIVCGDFNIFKGLSEIRTFIKENNLNLARKQATFPSIKPKRQLDLILAKDTLDVKDSGVVQVPYSDHLPVWVEIDS